MLGDTFEAAGEASENHIRTSFKSKTRCLKTNSIQGVEDKGRSWAGAG